MANRYICDTSVLWPLLRSRCVFGKPISTDQERRLNYLRNKILRLFQQRQDKILIPVPALIEMLSNIFQINIESTKYEEWYRQRRILVNQYIIGPVYSPKSNVRIVQSSGQSEIIAQNLIYQKISPPVCAELTEYYQTKKHKHPREPKLFDGMDSVIVAIAMVEARNNPEDQCMLLSNDLWLRYGFSSVCRLVSPPLGNLSFCDLDNFKI